MEAQARDPVNSGHFDSDDHFDADRTALRERMQRVAQQARERLTRNGLLEVELEAQKEIELRVRSAVRRHAA